MRRVFVWLIEKFYNPVNLCLEILILHINFDLYLITNVIIILLTIYIQRGYIIDFDVLKILVISIIFGKDWKFKIKEIKLILTLNLIIQL